jgi:hypothetical protein
VKYFDFAVDVLKRRFGHNLMKDGKSGLPRIDRKNSIVWLIGSKQTTNAILEDLKKHNIAPYVLRDSRLRRDYTHYFNGKMYQIARKEFKRTISLELAKMLSEQLCIPLMADGASDNPYQLLWIVSQFFQ